MERVAYLIIFAILGNLFLIIMAMIGAIIATVDSKLNSTKKKEDNGCSISDESA